MQHIGRGGRQRPLRISLAALVVGLIAALGIAGSTSAHAEPERAEPAINGVVPVAPAVVEIWFDEEVKTEGTTIQVIGPGGIQVDLGDAAVDLQDPNRQHVTVSLRPDLGPGSYTVQWVSVSGADNDEARGGYLVTVGAATPVATPEAADEPAMTPEASVTPVAEEESSQSDDFDSGAYGISVAVGLVFAVLIFLFWRLVRPKNPKFRG
ncbi:MAG: copper resistance protein CopC [Thermomicrobiales bacterium]|nr:copper resistance protein CopC [Thermomicrobiales bacterium]